MSDRVDEAVMLLIAANFADQKNRVEDKTGDDGAKENDAEKDPYALAPVEDDPSAANRKRHRRQTNAQREKSVNRFLSADDAHRRILIISLPGRRSTPRNSGKRKTGEYSPVSQRLGGEQDLVVARSRCQHRGRVHIATQRRLRWKLFEIDFVHVARQSQFFQRPDAVPVHVDFIPAQAVPR